MVSLPASCSGSDHPSVLVVVRAVLNFGEQEGILPHLVKVSLLLVIDSLSKDPLVAIELLCLLLRGRLPGEAPDVNRKFPDLVPAEILEVGVGVGTYCLCPSRYHRKAKTGPCR